MPLYRINTNGRLSNELRVTADFTSATWNTVATHEVFTVTGLVRLQIIPEITGSLTGGAGALISIGFETAGTNLLAATAVTTFANALIMLDTTPLSNFASTSIFDRVVNGADFGYAISVNPATAGSIVFHCFWEPLNSTGSVVAGTGISL